MTLLSFLFPWDVPLRSSSTVGGKNRVCAGQPSHILSDKGVLVPLKLSILLSRESLWDF